MSTYTKLDWNGKVVHLGLLCNSLTAWNPWEVYECGLNDTILPLGGFDELFGEALVVKSAHCRNIRISRAFQRTGILRMPSTGLLSQHPLLPQRLRRRQTGRLGHLSSSFSRPHWRHERLMRGASLSCGIVTLGRARLKRGTMVSPEWPPMTGMTVLAGSFSPVRS